MVTPLKCPNPSCTFLFDPSQVPPGAVLACPRCGLRFQLGPQAPAAPAGTAFNEDFAPPTRETSASPKPKPKAKSSSEDVDDEEDEEAPASKMPWKSILIASGVVGVVGFCLIFFIFIRAANRTKPEDNSDKVIFESVGLMMKKPDAESGWERNDSLKTNFSAGLFGYERKEKPGAWIIGDARVLEYQVRPSDIKQKLTDQLAKNFSEIPENIEGVPCTVLGLPGIKYGFRGIHRSTQDVMLGEVFTLMNNRLALWIYCYAPEQEYPKQEANFEAVMGLLKFNAKDTGGDAPKFEQTHRSKSGLFIVVDHEGIWGKPRLNPDTQDAAAQLWMRGTSKSSKSSNSDLVVAVLEPEGDIQSQAEKHVLAQMSSEYKMDKLTTDPTGDLPHNGELLANPEVPVTRLRVRYPGSDGTGNKMVAFAAITAKGKTVVAYAQCNLKEAEYWEQRMMQMVGTLKSGK